MSQPSTEGEESEEEMRIPRSGWRSYVAFLDISRIEYTQSLMIHRPVKYIVHQRHYRQSRPMTKVPCHTQYCMLQGRNVYIYHEICNICEMPNPNDPECSRCKKEYDGGAQNSLHGIS
jgi:hypothetical protein